MAYGYDYNDDPYGWSEDELRDAFEPSYTIILRCNLERVSAEDVKFLDIHEDMQGQDVMTFECPQCGETHDSLVFG